MRLRWRGRGRQGRPSLTNILEIVADFLQRPVHRLSLLDGARNWAVSRSVTRSPRLVNFAGLGRDEFRVFPLEESAEGGTALGLVRDREDIFDSTSIGLSNANIVASTPSLELLGRLPGRPAVAPSSVFAPVPRGRSRRIVRARPFTGPMEMARGWARPRRARRPEGRGFDRTAPPDRPGGATRGVRRREFIRDDDESKKCRWLRVADPGASNLGEASGPGVARPGPGRPGPGGLPIHRLLQLWRAERVQSYFQR